MRYCFFSAQYLPNIGGIERYTYYLAKKLTEHNDTVVVVTSKMKGQSFFEMADGVQIYRLPSFPCMDGRFPILQPCAAVKEIRLRLEHKEFDLVVVNTRFYIHSLYGMWFAKHNGIKCITIEHGSSHLTFNNKFLDKLEHLFEHTITFLGKRYCKDYYGVSLASCKWSGHFGIKSKGILYNAVDIDEIECLLDANTADYRTDYGIGEGDLVISYTGRLLQEKGIPQLLAAFKRLNSRKRMVLFLAGEGPLASFVQEAAEAINRKSGKKRVILLGKIDFPHIAALLKATDIFCLPSDSEGLSTSVLEAAAAKCFIITTCSGGTKELLRGPEYGIVMPDNHVGTLVESLEQAIGNGQYRFQAAERTYTALKHKFTFDRTVEKIRGIAGKDGVK